MSRKYKKRLDIYEKTIIIKIVIITILEDKMKKYSKQRQTILDILRASRAHPTAAQVYKQAREILPNISLGTVYRNLAALSESGEILSISVRDGFEHFDGDCSPHLHLHCRNCGSITDAELDSDFAQEALLKADFLPETYSCVVCGVCNICRK